MIFMTFLILSLFPFSLFSFLLSEVLSGQEHPPARLPLAAPPCRSSSSPPFFLPLEPSSLTRYESEVRFQKTRHSKPRSKLKAGRILPFSFVFGWVETVLGW